ncbi:arylsulfatase [Megasphaera hutchinsoni]|jgi:hypothetical protein|uniref:Arylsulfatase n=1 Tax=Megasphaera hutchinsoni TaxID=1588748 RepID=A0A2J8B8J0_9FIRM|nr:phosphoethanolamine transferase [Megasphaera genomosp. type_2]PNH21085.1 arylsulfatase [Megasphaera genomosp. type_2]
MSIQNRSTFLSRLFPVGSKKRTIATLILLYIILYAILYRWQYSVSLGLGADNIQNVILGLIPAVLAVVLPLGLYWHNISITSILPPTIVALGWIITGPYLNYTTLLTHNVIYINNIYDIYVGLYLFAILFCINMALIRYIPRFLSALIVTILQLASFFIIIIQWVYYLLYNSCITITGALLINQTGPRETKEYFGSLGMYRISGIILVLLIFIIGSYILNYRQKKAAITPLYTPFIPLISLFIIFPSIGALAGEILPTAFPIKTFIDSKEYLQHAKLYATTHDNRYAKLNAIQLHPRKDPNTIILVIGESETRTYMHVYNPSQPPNTPWLSEMKQDPHFTFFTNAYACVWYTVPVLEHALTEANFYNHKEFNQSISIIDMARKAGYKTYWFSNQGSVGVSDTPISLVAHTADVHEWVDRDAKYSTLDESLLKFLKKVNPKDRNFVVLHLMGSHVEYRNRYPAKFQKFNDGQINRVADFHNTILYNDWFLHEVYKYGKDHLNLDAMLYFSDHGSDPTRLRQPDIAPFTVLRIPMFCYLSDNYLQRNTEIAQTLKNHQNKYFTNDLAYELVCGILNMKSPHYDPSMSLASPLWKMERKDLVTRFGKSSLLEDKEY